MYYNWKYMGDKTKFLKCVCKRENSISDLVKKSKGTMIFQFNRDGVEEWGIIIDNKKVEEFRANLEQISTLTKFNVMDLEDVLVYPDLSASQLKVLSHAYKKGYFSFPKGTNVRELAKDLEISPVTLLYHLKRGEDAIIGHYLKLIK